MLYYALSTEEGPAGVAFVRVALPMTSIYREVARIKRLVWLVALGVGVVVLLVTYWIVARIVRPVGTLTEAAEVLARGDFSERIYLPGSDELATLGRAFNRMSDEQSARVAQLRASNDRLETVLSSMIEGVVAVDDSLCILFANSAAGRLLNFDARQAEGRPLLETIRNHTLYEAISDLFTDPKPLSFEFKSGQHPQRVLAVNAAPLTRDPSPGVVLVLHDMTELRKLETHRQEFVANVSHELKTPLAAIKAYAETLLDGALADPHNNVPFVRRIDEQANRLHQLILDLLSLARIESGEAGFEIGVVDLEPLIEASITQYQQAATAKGMNLQRAQDCPGLTVRADEEGMRQILGNLIDNAIKYTPAGGSVTVSWRSEAQDAVIEVADTGIGIAPDDQARLFERFYRVDRARSRELGGTGLGLSIVKHLAQAFSGEVSVRSEPGKGSTFSVRLPLATSGAGAMPR
jgi:two-component system phosphate regulon sensor histidine kinase PhoR